MMGVNEGRKPRVGIMICRARAVEEVALCRPRNGPGGAGPGAAPRLQESTWVKIGIRKCRQTPVRESEREAILIKHSSCVFIWCEYVEPLQICGEQSGGKDPPCLSLDGMHVAHVQRHIARGCYALEKWLQVLEREGAW